jgi:hypothetical protein
MSSNLEEQYKRLRRDAYSKFTVAGIIILFGLVFLFALPFLNAMLIIPVVLLCRSGGRSLGHARVVKMRMRRNSDREPHYY